MGLFSPCLGVLLLTLSHAGVKTQISPYLGSSSRQKYFSWPCHSALFMPYLKPRSRLHLFLEYFLTLSFKPAGPGSCWELWWVFTVMG